METEGTGEPNVPDTGPDVPEAERPPPPPSPTRWSERAPGRAALVYAAAYLVVAAAGGEVAGRIASPRLLIPLVIAVVLGATVLSLLFVLSMCRTRLHPGVQVLLFLGTTVIFLVCRPEVTLALAQWLRIPLRVVLRFPMLPDVYGGTLIGNLALITWAAIIGKGVAGVIREGNLLLPVAVVASLADIITVFWGFVGKASQVAPKVVAALSAEAPAAEVVQAQHLSLPILTYIGIGDFLFLAIFLTVALRHRMRAAAAMWAALVSMLVAAPFVNLSQYGIPGLPFISAGVLLVNRRCFRFSQEEKRALAAVGILVLVLLGAGAVVLLRRHG